MSRSSLHPSVGKGLLYMAITFAVFATAGPVMAGVGLPPMPNTKDTNAMEQYRVKVFYDAQKSQQEKMKVGQERYAEMLTNRAQIIQAMSAEVAERQKTITIEPESAASSYGGTKDSNTWIVTILGGAVIALAFLGFRYYLSRQEARNVVGRK